LIFSRKKAFLKSFFLEQIPLGHLSDMGHMLFLWESSFLLMVIDVYIQEAREKDISITDEMARSALGALGLTGEAALRPISALSGMSW
jgi:hypothetical protein